MLYPYLAVLLLPLIKSCPLKTVDSRSGCYCGIEIDGTNYIQCQPYSIELLPEFTRSYVHDKLNLSSNFIRNLTSQSFSQLKVKKIYLQQNLIESIDKEAFNHPILNYLEELHIDVLSKGSLEFLCYGSWTKLRVLELSGFHFDRFQTCLGKFPRLERFIIQHSHIESLSEALFTLPTLYEVSLTNNQMESIKFDQDFSALPSSIRIFNLTGNQLRTMPNDFLHRLPHLHTLDLSHNLLESLPIVNETHSFTLNLSYNLINHLELKDHRNNYDLSSNPICTLERSATNVNVSLKRITRLHCDCRLAFFLDENFVNKSKPIGPQQPFETETTCSTPRRHQGVALQTLTYEQLLATCSDQLPSHCKDVSRFKQIQQHAIDATGAKTLPLKRMTTPKTKVTEALTTADLSLFRLTLFYAAYENDNLIIHWDFDSSLSPNALTAIKCQIVLEQESSANTQILRRTAFISVQLKQYTIHHIPANRNYYICLLLTRSSFGTDKYCREIRTTLTTTISSPTLSKQAFVHMLFANRSIVFGFLVGMILTTGLLLTFAFICHLRSKRQHYRRAAASSMFHHPHPKQQPYLCIDRNDDDGAYSNSVFSSTSSKSNHFRKACHRTCFPPIPSDQSWYRRSVRQAPSAPPPPPPCCFHHHHHHTPDTSLSSSITTRRINTLSSQYSTGLDKEPMTSTSIMSSASSDEQTIGSPTKHVYEELADETTTLRRHNAPDAFL